jgi:riboflavin kinase/FMN adenylyltransferase
VLAPGRKLRRLQTRGQKLESLERTELGDLLILRFDEALAALSGEEFFQQMLLERVRFAAIHVGENFRFGRGRTGDISLLKRLGTLCGFEVQAVPTLAVDQRPVSSSAIRESLDQGDVATAARMLGRPFAVLGEVVHGDGRGRELGCPTANLALENEIVPAPGVYLTEAVVLASRVPSMTNVGRRPTFDAGSGEPVVETHLLQFDEDLYGERLELRFHARLRDERRFAGADELAAQLAHDRRAAQAYFEERAIERA